MHLKTKKLLTPTINTRKNLPGYSPPPIYESICTSYLTDGTKVRMKIYNFYNDVTNTVKTDYLRFFELILK